MASPGPSASASRVSGSKRSCTSDSNDHTPRRSKRIKELGKREGEQEEEAEQEQGQQVPMQRGAQSCASCSKITDSSKTRHCAFCDHYFCAECTGAIPSFAHCHKSGCIASVGCEIDPTCHGTDFRCFGCGSTFCSLEHGQLNFCSGQDCDSSSCYVCTGTRGHQSCLSCARRYCQDHVTGGMANTGRCDDCASEHKGCANCGTPIQSTESSCACCQALFCNMDCAYKIDWCSLCNRQYCRFCVRIMEDEHISLPSSHTTRCRCPHVLTEVLNARKKGLPNGRSTVGKKGEKTPNKK